MRIYSKADASINSDKLLPAATLQWVDREFQRYLYVAGSGGGTWIENVPPDITGEDPENGTVTIIAQPATLEWIPDADWGVSWSLQTRANKDRTLIQQSINDVKKIFERDNECSRYFEQAVKIATVLSTEGGANSEENVYLRYDASEVVETLGKQLYVGFLRRGRQSKTTGIEMYSSHVERTTIRNSENGLQYQIYEFATINVNGPFLGTANVGKYSGRAGRALMILHELAHMIRRRSTGESATRSPLIPGESGSTEAERSEQSNHNTITIQEVCKTELDLIRDSTNH